MTVTSPSGRSAGWPRCLAQAAFLVFSVVAALPLPAAARQIPAPDATTSARALAEFRAALEAGATWEDLESAPFAGQSLTKTDAEAARESLVAAWRTRLAAERRAEIESGVLVEGEMKMPFFMKTVGAKPVRGHSLWISLHGGGGAPARVNDQQWENQKQLYTVAEGIYVAPRAPTNTWNLWHEPHIDRLFHRLVEDLVVLGDVDPNRVYVLGYSAGGDGVYQLAPRMADHWAAAAMMAGHPNGVSLEPVRNVPFALQLGALDTAYDRARIGAEYGKALEAYRAADRNGYETFVAIREGKGHWMDREDAAALPWMATFTRNPVPDRIVWIPTGPSRRSFYWLALPRGAPEAPGRIATRREGQSIVVDSFGDAASLLVHVDDRMLDPDAAVRVAHGDRVLHDGPVRRTIASLVKTLVDRGDPELVFPGVIEVRSGEPPVSER